MKSRIKALLASVRRSPAGKTRPAPVRAGDAGVRPTIYAVGDIHGRFDLLLKLEARIRADLEATRPARSLLVFLGDYVDRGPQSRQVIAYLAAATGPCDERVYLRGNHEQVMLDFLKSASILESWSRFGGIETLVSYGLKPMPLLTPENCEALRRRFVSVLPREHKAFLMATSYSHETVDHFFAHAGVNPKFGLTQQQPYDLMWIRDEFLSSKKRFGKLVVHGHTPVGQPEVHANRINVDTCAWATGRLTAAVIEPTGYRFLSTLD